MPEVILTEYGLLPELVQKTPEADPGSEEVAVWLPRPSSCPRPSSWASEGCPGTAAPAWGGGGAAGERRQLEGHLTHLLRLTLLYLH